VDASKLGTTTRADGSTQVTYNGWPLYYFDKDKQPGDTTGQGVGTVWYLISAAGDALGKGS
jgi:predicted lipoprotein with Yx(FWY)xxD motif